MARTRLKVYRAQMGFAETVVAAPNQTAALQAWGARQNLFAEGMARVETDPKAQAAALERRGEVLQRPAGSADLFRAGAAAPPVLPASKTTRPAPKRAAPTPRPGPDRSDLDRAERDLKAVDADATAARADLERRRAELDAERRQLERDVDRRRRAAERALKTARAAYRRAGGKDPP